MSVERWSIWRANLDPVVGSEQGERRPVLVISETNLNDILPVVNVLPITSRKSRRRIYPNEALLTIVITLIVTMHNLAKTTQQETNRRIDDLKNDLKELLDAKFKVIDSQFEVVNVKFQKLQGDVADVRQEVQDIKRVIFKPAA